MKVTYRYILKHIDTKITKCLSDALIDNNNTVSHYRSFLENLINEIRTINEEHARKG